MSHQATEKAKHYRAHDMAIDGLLFILALAAAWRFQWQANDLIWSLWISSLLVGYSTILFSIIGFPIRAVLKPEKKIKKDLANYTFLQKAGGILLLLFIACFMLGFFTVHFCGFHYIHGMFLSSFFPLPDIKYAMDTHEWPMTVIAITKLYYPFVFVSAILSRKSLFLSSSIQEATVQPYKSVVRMHMMIFVFAFLSFLNVGNFGIYAITMAVYFLPWSKVRSMYVVQRKAKGRV